MILAFLLYSLAIYSFDFCQIWCCTVSIKHLKLYLDVSWQALKMWQNSRGSKAREPMFLLPLLDKRYVKQCSVQKRQTIYVKNLVRLNKNWNSEMEKCLFSKVLLRARDIVPTKAEKSLGHLLKDWFWNCAIPYLPKKDINQPKHFGRRGSGEETFLLWPLLSGIFSSWRWSLPPHSWPCGRA